MKKKCCIVRCLGTNHNKYSENVKGDSYYGYTPTHHSCYANYLLVDLESCNVIISIADGDWFDIFCNTTGKRFNDGGYIQFNADEPPNF